MGGPQQGTEAQGESSEARHYKCTYAAMARLVNADADSLPGGLLRFGWMAGEGEGKLCPR